MPCPDPREVLPVRRLTKEAGACKAKKGIIAAAAWARLREAALRPVLSPLRYFAQRRT